MIFDWYKILSQAEINDVELTSKEYTFILEGRGQFSFLLVKKNNNSIVLDNSYFPISTNEINPRIKGENAVYQDNDGFVWLGFMVEQ